MLRLTRIGVFVFLSLLLVLAGGAAKHSLFDSPVDTGYLAKVVKMAASPLPSYAGDEIAAQAPVFGTMPVPDTEAGFPPPPQLVAGVPQLPVLSAPLRI